MPGRPFRLTAMIVMLFVIQIALVALAVFISLKGIQKSEHAWCTIIHLSLSGQKPSNLSVKEREDYQAIVNLAKDYGCLNAL